MRLGAAFALSALILAGCASAPRGPAPEPFSAADSISEQALARIELASQESLTETAHLLSTPDAAGSPKTALLAALGSFLFRELYPELSNPFPASAPAPAETDTSVFLAHTLPALVLLGPESAIDDTQVPALGALLASAEEENSHSVLPPYLMGRLLEHEREAAHARALYEKCLILAPSFYPAAGRLGGIIIAAGTARTELALLERLADMLPTAPLRYAALGKAYLAAGEPEKAADAAAQGLLSAPDDPRFALLRAQAFEQKGDWYQSLRLLEALLKLTPDEPAVILMKARLLFEKAKNSQEAIRVLADAEGRFPSNADFPELHGRVLIETGRPDDGVTFLTQALSLAPGRLSILTSLLRQAVLGERWNQATAWLGEIPAQDWAPEHFELGWQVATALGEHARAIQYAQQLELRAGGAGPLALQARSLVAMERPEQALLLIDHALLSMDPKPATKAQLLVIRSTAGSEDPLHDLRAALLEDPRNVPALVGLSDVLAKAHDYRKAMEYAKLASTLSPGNASLAQKVIDLGKLAESRK
ncbi:MAG: tetratricopeptide repeat protein [Spirochaetia bacterium]|jgi:tetratricopeptide (TPR) repeat protein